MPHQQDPQQKTRAWTPGKYQKSAVTGIAAGGHTSDVKDTSNKGTPATAKTLATAMPPIYSRRDVNSTRSSSRVGRRRDAENTVNSKTKDVCKSKDARKDTPPAAAIDTETRDSPSTSKQSRDASNSNINRKKGKDARKAGRQQHQGSLRQQGLLWRQGGLQSLHKPSKN
jgi:hypothetical protein